jgi:hypothetical protein
MDVPLRGLDDLFVLLLVVLLFQMQLLEKLELLKDGQHVILRKAGEIQG